MFPSTNRSRIYSYVDQRREKEMKGEKGKEREKEDGEK